MSTDPTRSQDDLSASQPLTRELLATVQGISLLGQIAAKGLLDYGQITFFLNADHVVEMAPTKEVSLDALPEVQALEVLVAAGYADTQLATYLRGRDARRRMR